MAADKGSQAVAVPSIPARCWKTEFIQRFRLRAAKTRQPVISWRQVSGSRLLKAADSCGYSPGFSPGSLNADRQSARQSVGSFNDRGEYCQLKILFFDTLQIQSIIGCANILGDKGCVEFGVTRPPHCWFWRYQRLIRRGCLFF